ncbi:hypothetical protein LIMHP_04275 [Leptospira interrogans serovar Manilae]|nr:hypothetical protein LIMLP_04290 [Leptospira interrogans serovar Manilae]AKP29031.1 hypothetical protein LIMHP_04275 [Leptospira interrogans serovar Manilae]
MLSGNQPQFVHTSTSKLFTDRFHRSKRTLKLYNKHLSLFFDENFYQFIFRK